MTPEKKAIIVIGSSNTDMVIRTRKMPRPGETVLGGDFMMNHGGKGANQAVAAAKLGGATTFVGKVGNDVFGRQTIEMLRGLGIDVRHLGVSETHPSGLALSNVDDSGENSIAVASGANADLSVADIDAAEEAIRNAALIIMQLESPLETVTYAAAMAKKHGVPVILNPAPAPAKALPEELMANVDIIIPNETEAEIISGIEITDAESELKAINKIHSMGVKTVIFTLGSDGALVCENGECEKIPSFKVKAVDTTAAGDTFCGALCVALSEGKPVKEAVLFANKAASISVTRMGAQQSIPTRAELSAACP
ncbi:MAG: ribokinase, partial [Muribaculaceae bacterium]|nr:ribokinase [Muribaculaceae bacterium]